MRPAPRAPALVPAAVALACALATPRARAERLRVTSTEPAFTALLPEGFERAPSASGGAVLGSFAGRGRETDGVLLTFLRAGPELPQGAGTAELRARVAPADAFAFRDRPEAFRALGFALGGLRGEAEVAGHRVVRFAVALPLAGETAAVLALAPAEQAPAARAALDATLATTRGRTHWTSPAGRAFAWAAGAGAAIAAALSLLYALLALARSRLGGRGDLLRAGLLAPAGLGWCVFGAWLALHGGAGGRWAGALLVAVGVVAGAQGLGTLRRRYSDSGVR